MAGKNTLPPVDRGGNSPLYYNYEMLIAAIYKQAIWDIKYCRFNGQDYLTYISARGFLRKDPYEILDGMAKKQIENIIEFREMGGKYYGNKRKLY